MWQNGGEQTCPGLHGEHWALPFACAQIELRCWNLAFFRQYTSDDRRPTTDQYSCDTRIRQRSVFCSFARKWSTVYHWYRKNVAPIGLRVKSGSFSVRMATISPLRPHERNKVAYPNKFDRSFLASCHNLMVLRIAQPYRSVHSAISCGRRNATQAPPSTSSPIVTHEMILPIVRGRVSSKRSRI